MVLVKPLSSATSQQYGYKQPQVIVYINDNFDQVLDYPRYYIYPDEWNRMHFNARFVELLEHPEDCSTKVYLVIESTPQPYRSSARIQVVMSAIGSTRT
jgi:hypothetical protein